MTVDDRAPRKSPSTCETLADARLAIDALDGEIIDLFAERLAYIRHVVGIKRAAGLPAAIPERVAEVVGNARRNAEQRGLDPELFGPFWEKLVDAAIAEEERLLGG
ncbi:MAG: chorismate mutase [Rhizobiaceae bacterium]|nr:chorismate mutase [Rhizobiaceae bacterium]